MVTAAAAIGVVVVTKGNHNEKDYKAKVCG